MSKPIQPRVWRFRSRLLFGVLTLGALTLGWRAVDLHVFEKGFLSGQARARHQRVVSIPAHRGMITDRHGEPLAVSTPVDSVWVNPQAFPVDTASIRALAKVAGVNPRHLETRLESRADREFVYVRRHMVPEDAERVRALALPGVYTQREYRRYYPTGEVTAHLVGFTDIDDRGQEGMELAYDEWLRGVPGRRRVMRDGRGNVIDDLGQIEAPRPGQALALSVDRRLQYLAYRELKAAIAHHRAKSGSVVVLDVATGEILAAANQPGFNPNNRTGMRGAQYRNRAATDVFEPGSTIKPFVVAAAMGQGVFQPTSHVDTTPGWFSVHGGTVRDLRNYGRLDLGGVLAKSSNVGASKIALATPREALWNTLRQVGFGGLTASGFPGERAGRLRHFHEWYTIDHATLAFGYGVSVTALQLAQAYSVLATDGQLRPVSLVKVSGDVTADTVLKPSVVREVRQMMERVVTEGTASAAAIPAYRVAGKTGTARKPGVGGYTEDRYLALFAGMVPASRPRLVGVVVINEPQGDQYHGGTVAAPVFSRVMSGALRLMDISPDDLPENGGWVISPGDRAELG
ncbi:MAG: penicillin-binding transpeptidase domain-containing protein [Pseudomonadota bacterium]|nr:penicillin-binding transpeptidase domain-containing protein [Pseudomonadota bacterium]